MTQYNRPSEAIFASGAKPGEVENFPDIQRGWGISLEQTAGSPPMEWFNALFKRNDEAVRYLLQRGLSEWSATEDYPLGAYVQETGKTWKSKTANTGKRPSSNAADWTEWGLTRDELNTAYAAIGHGHSFASLSDKPSTLAGYGISDAMRGQTTVLSLNADMALTSAQVGLLLLDAAAGQRNLTLPAATTALGTVDIIVRRLDNTGNVAKVMAGGTDKIKFHTHLSATGYGFFYLMGAGDWWHLRSDGAGNWWVIGRFDPTPLGRPVFETTASFAPGGYGALNGTVFNRADWPWLWDHARQSGMLASEAGRVGREGGWTSGDGALTFRGPEGRGEFLRILDEERGVDLFRTAGSSQMFNTNISRGQLVDTLTGIVSLANGPYISGALVAVAGLLIGSTTETRPRNIAYPGRIKLI